jgi:cyclic beta-1,2-glucan synthetase
MKIIDQNHGDTLGEAEVTAPAAETSPPARALKQSAEAWAQALVWLPGVKESAHVAERQAALARGLDEVLGTSDGPALTEQEAAAASEDERWFLENVRLVRGSQSEFQQVADALRQVPHVRTPGNITQPRVVAIAEGLLQALNFRYSDKEFSAYMEAFQAVTPLTMHELAQMPPALKLVLLEELVVRGRRVLDKGHEPQHMEVLITSTRNLSQAPWQEFLEPLIAFEPILAADPAAAYARMDFESRELYRRTVAHYAEHSDCSELEIAQLAIDLAKEAQAHHQSDPRLALRKSHVGYYLIDAGAERLRASAGVRLPFAERLQAFLRNNPEEFYLGGIETLTLLIVIAIMTPVFNAFGTFYGRMLAILLLLLPCSQSAVEVMNYLTTALLHPRILPKLDFGEHIPDDCVTMVVVPTLLLNEKQVRRLVEDLEVRYLGNTSRNLHFGLLTDLADSTETPQEDDPLVDLCAQLITDLNEKYPEDAGRFLLLHRHRVFNPREGVWMGWERKRGKLLDFNRLIQGKYDSFPVKIGDVSVLSRVRFVLTLDSDTELPRGTARRLVGAMAHPLNQAVVDPRENIVVAGYGILQPRVGISVLSAAQSRLANIYSGQTGFDIYTRATSDVYQDLNGEGIFTGKGIYELETLSRVLERRFPRNALLSHDLIEGAYARAGLVSDVEVIDDYPSRYSAFNRRKHRWLRGDWQVAPWLFGRVRDESGRRVPNPISFLSRWKIVDNLRRSLVEPGIFLLFVLGWAILPGRPLYWTLVTVAILFVPPWFQFAFSSARAIAAGRLSAFRDAMEALGTSTISVLLTLTFLAHQTLLSADAVLRTFYRRMVSRERLLEWETAAEAEMGTRKLTFVDVLLNWTPAVALIVGVVVYLSDRRAIFCAAPILLLWAFSKPIALWLNRPPRPREADLSGQDERFLRREALHIWRYFATHSNPEQNWLIPDNVQEEGDKVAARTSPTNIGLLLNARQVACEFGYLTLPAFAEETRRSLDTILRMQRQRGHPFNWYDTRTLEALKPRFISTVDSANLVASLITLRGGSLEMLQQPLLSPALLEGYANHLCALAEMDVLPKRVARSFERQNEIFWLDRLLSAGDRPPLREVPQQAGADARWFAGQASALTKQVRKTVSDYMPWLLPEFAVLREGLQFAAMEESSQVTLLQLPGRIDAIQTGLQIAVPHGAELRKPAEKLVAQLAAGRGRSLQLIDDLKRIATDCEQLIRKMDFAFLFDRRRKLLSIGYDAETATVQSACYDLLASEARTATFIAVAKGDIPQESWFMMSRSQVLYRDSPVLISWTGTMFEYLMPALWMRSYPETLLDRSTRVAVEAQQTEAAAKNIPWGISECAYARTDEQGTYLYAAFGLPQLALQQDQERLVVAPYATMLALGIDPVRSIENLRWMMKKNWFGRYGFYEAADFTADVRPSRRQRYALVREWMAHHQGMSLLAIANLLHSDIVRKWFHHDPRVQATELLLQERPIRHAAPGAKRARQRSRAPRRGSEKKIPATV